MTNPTPNEQADEELFMVLEKYKEDIKFLHHQIRGQELTPDEILAKEDTETNKAKAALQALIAQHTKAAVIDELNEVRKWATKAESTDQVWRQITDRLAELATAQKDTK